MKSTGRDIWAMPPGGFETKPKRHWVRPAVAAGLVLSLGLGGGALYQSMKRSTAVSTEDAIAQFRAGSAESSDSTDRSGNAGESRSKGDGATGSDKDAGRRAKSGDPQGAVAAQSSGANQGTGSAERSSVAAAKPGRDRSRQAAAADPIRPEDGVYTWNVDGVERGPGVERRLPRRSHRIITYEGERAWEEHHIFSEQKEQWFHLGSSDEGVFVSEVRNRVEMGPVEVDKTITYDPPAFVSRFPFEVGQTWKGSWDGPTHGSYNGRTLDHGTIVIGGQEVEVWVTEVKMEMRGDVEGSVLTRSWVAPAYSMVVKQYQKTNVRSGPGDYYSEWEGQLVSLSPER